MMNRSMLLALSWGTFSLAPLGATDLPPQLLPVYGGSSGTAFTRSCASGQVLTGFRYRLGWWIDAIGVLCRPVNENGTLGSETTAGTLAGGGGGTSGSISCPVGSVIGRVLISSGSFVDGIHFSCRAWDASTRKFGDDRGQWAIGKSAGNREVCEDSRQPGHGVRGRSATYVDAFGLICDEP
jgi:hypothetical protein